MSGEYRMTGVLKIPGFLLRSTGVGVRVWIFKPLTYPYPSWGSWGYWRGRLQITLGWLSETERAGELSI
jgi:hypothetical protein